MEALIAWEADNGVFEWKNGQFTYQETVPTLLQISSFKVAFDIWNSCVSRTILNIRTTIKDNSNCKVICCSSSSSKSIKILMDLELPDCLKKMIDNHLRTISRKVLTWDEHLSYKINCRLPRKYRINLVDPECLVWRSSGNMDCKKTVSRILSGAKLNETQKFIVMCKFCRIDDIINISLSSLSPDFIENITFQNDPLIFYWICYLRNELHKIPLPDGFSINVVMARKCYRNIFAFEYFWDRSNTNDQIIEAMGKLESAGSSGYVFMKSFVPKMTQSQQHRLFCEKLADIVLNMWIYLRKPQCAIAIWLSVKDDCTCHQFAKLVRTMLNTNLIITSQEGMQLFLDLWNTASDHLKRQVAQIPTVKCVMKSFRCYKNHPPSSLKFLHDFLLFADPLTRQTAMGEILTKFPTHFAHSLIMIDVLKLCYPINIERERFLELVLNLRSTQKHGLCLMNDEKFDSLSVMLEILSPGINVTRKFIKRVLEIKGKRISNIEKWKFILNYDKWKELCNFIDKTCASNDDPVWVSNIKKQFVSSFASAFGFCWQIKGQFDELTKVLDEVLTPEEVELFKKTLLKEFKNNITKNEYVNRFEEQSFVELASWCLGDVGKIEELKSSLPRDKILNLCFASICHRFLVYNLSEIFNPLNKWLKFFYNNDEAKRYKLRKIYEFNDVCLLNELFHPRLSYLKKNLDVVLQHIFENDVKEMEKWRLSKRAVTRKRQHSDCDNGCTTNDPLNDAHPDACSDALYLVGVDNEDDDDDDDEDDDESKLGKYRRNYYGSELYEGEDYYKF